MTTFHIKKFILVVKLITSTFIIPHKIAPQ